MSAPLFIGGWLLIGSLIAFLVAQLFKAYDRIEQLQQNQRDVAYYRENWEKASFENRRLRIALAADQTKRDPATGRFLKKVKIL